jgi:hypothetical protein
MMRLSIFVSSLLLLSSSVVPVLSQNHTTVARDVSHRLQKYNRAAQAAVAIDSKDAAKAFRVSGEEGEGDRDIVEEESSSVSFCGLSLSTLQRKTLRSELLVWQ